jgi:alkaline phosphatase
MPEDASLNSDLGPSPVEDVVVVKNVIFMVPDGLGSAQQAAYRWFKGSGSAPVWEDGFQAMVRTGSANSPTTDSAAAATAFATGVKTSNGAVGVDADGNPLVSILTLASDSGKATGIVSTAAITDATPAAFAASALDRADLIGIAQQYVDNDILDVILGGGRAAFSADPDGDGATTLEEAQAAGFSYVATPEEMLASTDERLLGLFSEGDLGPPIGNGDIGARPSGEPSLAEMTTVALDRLSTDADGFFLVVEEEGTDLWGHANDAATVMHAAKSYEDAVRVARSYAEENPGTLVISVADHETGGMTLPFSGGRTPAAFRSFTATTADVHVAIGDAVAALGPDPDPALVVGTARHIVSDATGGVVVLTDAEIASVLDAGTPAAGRAALAAVLNAAGGVEYSTTGHTAADVPLHAFGAGAELHDGVIENTDVAEWLAEAMGLTLPADRAGADVISGTSADDHLVGTEDADVIRAGWGDDRLVGLGGNDQLEGGEGDDRLNGRSGNDVLSGAEGDDSLRGGVGDDQLLGGDGSDVFVFGDGVGLDRLRDFAIGEDAIHFRGGLFADAAAVLAASQAADEGVLIALAGGGEIRIDGIDLVALESAMFVFD